MPGLPVSPSPAGTPRGLRVSFPGSRWSLPGGALDLESPRIMGVLNLTPDSFSDGGLVGGIPRALELARGMVEAGADLVDVGGESTRPGAGAVAVAEEVRRVVPFIEAAAPVLGVPISVDTRRAKVARAAIDAGAAVVNDVSGLRHDAAMAPLVAERGVGVVLMHMRGEPSTMMEQAVYGDLLAEVRDELAGSLEIALSAGVLPERIVLDPGIGFAKTAEQSLVLLRRLAELGELGYPLLVGPSRKSFLGKVLGVPPRERAAGTASACVLAYLEGARVFRVHDVEPVAQALAVARAVRTSGAPSPVAGSETRG